MQPLQTIVQLGLLADADNVEQCFTVAALTLAVISGPLFVVGYIVAVVY